MYTYATYVFVDSAAAATTIDLSCALQGSVLGPVDFGWLQALHACCTELASPAHPNTGNRHQTARCFWGCRLDGWLVGYLPGVALPCTTFTLPSSAKASFPVSRLGLSPDFDSFSLSVGLASLLETRCNAYAIRPDLLWRCWMLVCTAQLPPASSMRRVTACSKLSWTHRRS